MIGFSIVIRPKIAGLVDHVGLQFPSGEVLHATPGRNAHVSSLAEFAEGKPVSRKPVGCNPALVLQRARQELARNRPYDSGFNNCEHLVSRVLSGNGVSPQAVGIVAIAGLVAAAILLARR
jgi:hypothetical protein